METTQLMDPAWWADDMPVAPGAELPKAAELKSYVWFQSSGSTGRPKWIGHSRDALLLSASMVNRHLEVQSKEVWGLPLPLRHVGGFGIVARAYESGAKLAVYPRKWQAKNYTDWLEVEKVNHSSLVPTQVHDIISQNLRAPACLRSIVVGGGRLAEKTGQKARNLGWPILASYGLTEAASQVATQCYSDLEKDYSADNLAILPHWQVSLAANEILSLSGAALFRAMLYLNTETKQWVFQERSKIEPFLSSDRGLLSSDGRFLSILGRTDHQIKILGELVDIDQIESQFNGECIVLAVSHPRREHELILFGTAPAAELSAQLNDYNEKVPGPWRISRAIFLDSLPLTSIGKPDRQALRKFLV